MTVIYVAIVGSGPSGFFAAETLLKHNPELHVDMFEKLPVPFGLVRYGVAPDHQKIKRVCTVFDLIAASDRFRFFGNVSIGIDLSVDELRHAYSAVVIAIGASRGSDLGIPGEHLRGVIDAVDLVGYYNGHPEQASLGIDLSQCRSAVIVGQGNVACDVARILMSPSARLARTDISRLAHKQLEDSGIEKVSILGRRGPAQLKVTAAELRELIALPDCTVRVDAAQLKLNPESAAELTGSNASALRKVFETLASTEAGPLVVGKGREILFDFHKSPAAALGNGHVERLVLQVNRLQGAPFHQVAVATERSITVECDLLIRCTGYRGTALNGVPFDAGTGTIPHLAGAVRDESGRIVTGLYVTGWIKRGATGIVGTNRLDSSETVATLFQNLSGNLRRAELRDALMALLTAREVESLAWNEWKSIDQCEIARGAAYGKPREKLIDVNEMIRVAKGKKICEIAHRGW